MLKDKSVPEPLLLIIKISFLQSCLFIPLARNRLKVYTDTKSIANCREMSLCTGQREIGERGNIKILDYQASPVCFLCIWSFRRRMSHFCFYGGGLVLWSAFFVDELSVSNNLAVLYRFVLPKPHDFYSEHSEWLYIQTKCQRECAGVCARACLAGWWHDESSRACLSMRGCVECIWCCVYCVSHSEGIQ